jgi:hypothetical protein
MGWIQPRRAPPNPPRGDSAVRGRTILPRQGEISGVRTNKLLKEVVNDNFEGSELKTA